MKAEIGNGPRLYPGASAVARARKLEGMDPASLLERRRAGVLLHPTSLPGPHGGGDLGLEARRFVDFLAEAGQRWWQILPLGPPGPADSPYAARSAFAGSPLLVSLEGLVSMGLLDDGDLPSVDGDAHVTDHGAARAARLPALRRAWSRFPGSGFEAAVDAFAARSAWLAPYALFAAIREQHPASWTTWPGPLRAREATAIREARDRLADEIGFQVFIQWLFDRQWHELRAYARERGISILGDLPIFVDHDSADAWWHRDIFRLDGEGHPDVVTGVPPDYFSATGQRWGNPHFRWDVLEARGFDWWVERMRRTYDLVDAVRIDHFRGFAAAWEIPAENDTAVKGRWVPGPGQRLFHAIHAALGPIAVVAEDLGIITPDVEALRDDLGYPGMLVLQFAFDGGSDNPYLPHNHRSAAVVYTGTHDNDTTLGWWSALPRAARERVAEYLGSTMREPVDDLARAAYRSVARIAVLPMQDVLRLGSEARMNLPAVTAGNWRFRFTWDQVPAGRAAWLRRLAETYGR